MPILAQTPSPVLDTFWKMLPWLLVLFVAVLIGGFFLIYVRNRMKEDDTPTQDTGFTLADLRALRDRGELSPGEYEVAKNKIVAKVKQAAERPHSKPDQRDDF